MTESTTPSAKTRKILIWPNFVLSSLSREVSKEEVALEENQQLIADMIATMRANNGFGLSAIQVGVGKRIMVMAVDKQDLVFINPTLKVSGEQEEMVEGCLSTPGIFERVKRYPKVEVRYLTKSGSEALSDFENTQAQCLQHEVEHMDGKMFLEKLPKKLQRQIRENLINLKKRTGR